MSPQKGILRRLEREGLRDGSMCQGLNDRCHVNALWCPSPYKRMTPGVCCWAYAYCSGVEKVWLLHRGVTEAPMCNWRKTSVKGSAAVSCGCGKGIVVCSCMAYPLLLCREGDLDHHQDTPLSPSATTFEYNPDEQNLGETTEEEEQALREAFEKGFGLCFHHAE